MSTATLTTSQVRAMAAAASQSPAKVALRRFRARPAAMAALFVVVFFVIVAVFAPLDRARRSDQNELVADPQGAFVGALDGHRRERPRRAEPRDLRRPRFA